MAEEPPPVLEKIPRTAKQKLLFYTTSFFILLGIFSLFIFLFLVPFIIEPAYTTLQMDFNLKPAQCFTAAVDKRRGLSNCTWTSCKEGCTKEVYECTQILVNYRHPEISSRVLVQQYDDPNSEDYVVVNEDFILHHNDYSYQDDVPQVDSRGRHDSDSNGNSNAYPPWITDKESVWFFGAKLYPNVKGCGYPPYLNCTVFNETYVHLGKNYSCYYSRKDPGLVITDLDMEQVHTSLVLALVVPIVCFIVSCIYTTIAYFYIYDVPKMSASQKSTPARKKPAQPPNASSNAIVQVTPLALSTPLAPPTSGILSPASEVFREDVAFGDQLKYDMVDESMLSKESLDSLAFNSLSSSINGNLNKMMTTCILTPPGPIAQL